MYQKAIRKLVKTYNNTLKTIALTFKLLNDEQLMQNSEKQRLLKFKHLANRKIFNSG